ncbi:hypothetical protein ACFODZ_01520 [Marinicella sediminis]|uniref:Uncharacterized protein n=1 Tax=Marinicella sediminis TaxID=1792834 RepID=A0ABV7J4R2_9GAMM|nr:hypothetical protein [Marinicella sediminis]
MAAIPQKFDVPNPDRKTFKRAVELADQLIGHTCCSDKKSVLSEYNALTSSCHSLGDFDVEMCAEEFVGIDLLPEPNFAESLSESDYISLINALRYMDDEPVQAVWFEKILTEHHPGFRDIYNRFDYEKLPEDPSDIYHDITSGSLRDVASFPKNSI